MSDEKALLAAIWEQPHEDTPRLVYADWLQENDQPERAEFIRVQCELARIDMHDTRRSAIEARCRDVFIRNVRLWNRGSPAYIRRINSHTAYDRGFPHPGELNLRMFLATTGADWEAAPLWQLSLSIQKARQREFVGACLESKHLLRVSELTLLSHWDNPADRRWQSAYVQALARSPLTLNVTRLVLQNNWVGPEPVVAIAAPTAFPLLTKLSLRACAIRAESLEALAASPLASRLTSLDISINGFGDADVRVLAGSPAFPALRELRLGEHWATEDGYLALASWPGLATLHSLDIGSGPEPGFTPAVARAFAESPHLPRLNTLLYPMTQDSEIANLLYQRFGHAYGH